MLTLPDYQVYETLHATANSIVYRGQRTGDKTPVVLKHLNKTYPTPVERARFEREFEVTRHLQGSRIIKVLDLVPYQHSLLLVLEDFGALSLKQFLAQRTLSLEERLLLALDITEGLAELHDQGVMHKDINPANIVLNPATRQLKFIDFGLATTLARESALRHTPDQLEGTLAYLSPEQSGRMNRVVDYRTDLYSLGVTLYELFTDRLPFVADDPLALVHAHIAQQPPSPNNLNPAIPPLLSDIILKLLEKMADRRYQSARGLHADLKELQQRWQPGTAIDPFALGRWDRPLHFQLPQKLYGRKKELHHLLTTFERVSQGQSEVLLVAGQAGVGKTALINELHRPVAEQGAFFIRGKFDQLQRNIPYSALAQAFRGLIRQRLAASHEQVARWSDRLLSALGTNGRIIIEIIPEVEQLIGPQPPVPMLGPAETQNRFQLVFQSFVEVFARPEHPLLLFLDDLQWADLASLRLLSFIFRDPLRRHLLLLGAYRDNEVDTLHPLRRMQKEVEEAKIVVTNLVLDPLAQEHITQFVADTIQGEPEAVRPLASVVFAKTGGNPFFVGEFLKTLHQEGLLRRAHSAQSTGWQWELAQIQAREIADNVVELLRGKLHPLPEETQRLLKIAACLGNVFRLTHLARVATQPAHMVAAALRSALQEGLLLPLGEGYRLLESASPDNAEALASALEIGYRFAHDRVQQAAYDLIGEAERPVVHLCVGRLLLASEDRELFEVVDHLNLGAPLITDEAEREQLARLNLEAGQQAKASAAYEPAAQYLQTGLSLLPAGCWRTQYELTLTLHQAAAESAFLKSDFAKMEILVVQALPHARTALEKVRLQEVLIQAESVQGRIEASIQRGREALAHLGIALPDRATKAHVLVDFLRTRLVIGQRSVASLASLPKMKDPEKLATMRLLNLMAGYTLYTLPDLGALLTCQMVRLSIQHGNAPASPAAYAIYGMALCFLGDIDRGYEFGQLASTVVAQPESYEFRAAVSAFCTMIRSNKEPLRANLSHYQAGYQSGIEAGDSSNALVNVAGYIAGLYFVGTPLALVKEESKHYLTAMKRTFDQHSFYFWSLTFLQQVLANLMEPTKEPHLLSGADFDEETLLARSRESNELILRAFYMGKTMLCYHFGEYAQTLASAEKAGVDPNIALWQSLALLALYPEASKAEQKRYLKKVAANQKAQKKRASHAPMNYQHHYELVEAERARVLGKDKAAIAHYQQAIKLARTHQFLQDEALANELTGRYYLAQELPQIAQVFLRQACEGYRAWGAEGKVHWLEQRYPQLLSQEKGQWGWTQAPTPTTTGQQSLDMATVMKATRALSSKIVLSELLETLIQLVIESAGAQRGFLILEEHGQLLIEAEGSVERAEVALQSLPVEQSQTLATTIVNYVARSGQDVLLDHASRETHPFLSDPYIVQQRPRSILCIPLVTQGKLVGVLYLENNRSAGAFTQERLEMLKLLSAQGAISIKNARLYAQQVELTAAATRFVPREFLEYLGKRSITEAALGDQVQQKMTVFFADIRSFTTLSESMTPEENFRFLNNLLGQVGPVIREHGGFIDKYLGDGIMALFPRQADDAVQAAIRLQQTLMRYNAHRQAQGQPPLEIGIGIHTGDLMLGIIGEAERMEGTVISDVVNTASRLEGLTKLFGCRVLISEQTLEELTRANSYNVRCLGESLIRGKKQAVTLFEVLDGEPERLRALKCETREAFERGLRHYQAGHFAEAHDDFSRVLAQNPEDRAAHRYQEWTENGNT